jgi:MFS family permease
LNPTTPQRLALAVGAVQLFLALTWTVYLVTLPKLAEAAGIAPALVPWIVALDQLVIAVCDWAAGVWADRAGRSAGRIGKLVLAATVVSCGAFLALPFAALDGDKRALLALTVLWSATSSALRAPPLVLIGRRTPKSSHGLFAALLLLGLGVAGAASPYLATFLHEVDARILFVLAAFALLAVTWVLASAESMLPRDRAAATPEPARAVHGGTLAWFLSAVFFLGAAFQLHVAVDMAPAYLKFAQPALLERLTPLFWVGFSLALVPGAALAKAWGGPLAMASGAVIAAAAAFVVAAATDLNTVIVAQLVAGAGWAVVLASALAAALSFGRIGAEGKFVGGLYSMLAVVTLARLAAVATAQTLDVSAALPWAPTVGWLLAAIVLLCMLTYGKARNA